MQVARTAAVYILVHIRSGSCFSLITKEVAATTLDGSAAPRSSRAYVTTGLLRVRNKVLTVSSSACQSCVGHGRKARKKNKYRKNEEKKRITRIPYNNQLARRSIHIYIHIMLINIRTRLKKRKHAFFRKHVQKQRTRISKYLHGDHIT